PITLYCISRVTTRNEEREGAKPIYRNTGISNYWFASGRPFLRTFFAKQNAQMSVRQVPLSASQGVGQERI
ncbi:MAG: hypothetical protein KAV87_02615, partial [Desulfobacteraceae bacterium]|nr:hypothetical protein [Desulfobacteraceae bacterium]